MVTNTETGKVCLLRTIYSEGLYVIYCEGGDASKKLNRLRQLISKDWGFFQYGQLFFFVQLHRKKPHCTVWFVRLEMQSRIKSTSHFFPL